MLYKVGIADMKVAVASDDLIVTYALGSCLGITAHDPLAGVGGLLHVMLPLSTTDPAKAAANPYMFVDTGLPEFFRACCQAGAREHRLVIKVAGGARTRVNDEDDYFQIGKKNFLMLKTLLRKSGVLLKAYDVGGNHSRTLSLNVGSGEVVVKANGDSRLL